MQCSIGATKAPAPIRVTWFDDRIEIVSPGGPFGEVTTESLGLPGVTDYRNPSLAEAMRALGWVQKFGAGIETARAALRKNGNPALELRAEHGHVIAVLKPAA